jgi:hypothetical protein
MRTDRLYQHSQKYKKIPVKNAGLCSYAVSTSSDDMFKIDSVSAIRVQINWRRIRREGDLERFKCSVSRYCPEFRLQDLRETEIIYKCQY